MKPFSIGTAAILAVMSMASTAEARRGGAVYSSGETIMKVADLPETEIFAAGGGEYYDVGWMHEQFSIFWMPLWGSAEGRYVLYHKASGGWRYVPLPDELLPAVSEISEKELSAAYPMSPMSNYWGWLIIAPLCFAAFLKKLRPSSAPQYAPQPMRGEARRGSSANQQAMDAALKQALQEHKAAQANTRVAAGGSAQAAGGFGRRGR